MESTMLDDAPTQIDTYALNWREWLRGTVARPHVRGLQFGAGHGNAASWLLTHILTGSDSHLVCVDTNFGAEFLTAIAAFGDRVELVQGGTNRLHDQPGLVRLFTGSDLIGAVEFAYLDGRHDAYYQLG